MDNVYFGLDLIPEDELEHYGMPKRSGRYAWGSGENPYHHGNSKSNGKPKDSGLFGRKKSNKKSSSSSGSADSTPEEREADIASGDPKRIAKHVKSMSDNELRQVTSRMKLESEFSRLAAEANPKGKSTLDSVLNGVEKVNRVANDGITFYNNFAKIHNVFVDDAEDRLPIVGEKQQKKENQS